jgi:hypothetical protein
MPMIIDIMNLKYAREMVLRIDMENFSNTIRFLEENME